MTVPLTPAQQALAVVRIVAAVVLVAALAFAVWKVNDWRTRAAQAEGTVSDMTGTAQATEATTGVAGAAIAERQQLDIVLHQGRAAAVQATEDLSNADPTVAELRARPLPDGLREIYRARREARDRPAGAAAGD